MELTRKSIRDQRESFIQAGYRLPEFDYEKVKAATDAAPTWIHFGAGNIFRAFQCNVLQNLLNAGAASTGLTAWKALTTRSLRKCTGPTIIYPSWLP